MTKFMSRSFAVHLGSKDYRDNYDRVFGKKAEEPEDNLDALEREAARYRKDGMPEDVIKAIMLCRIRGNRKWEEGKKESADFEHSTARSMMLKWYESVGKEPPK